MITVGGEQPLPPLSIFAAIAASEGGFPSDMRCRTAGGGREAAWSSSAALSGADGLAGVRFAGVRFAGVRFTGVRFAGVRFGSGRRVFPSGQPDSDAASTGNTSK
jgi:hypothetical protein